MINILTITGPIYLSIALGFAATRRGMFSKVEGQVLGRFVLNFALPAMLFNTLTQRDFSEVLNPNYLIAYGVGSIFTFAVGWGFWRVWRKKPLTESAMVAMGVATRWSSSEMATPMRWPGPSLSKPVIGEPDRKSVV